MKRTVLSVVAGLVVWTIIVSLLNRGVRLVLPGYTEAEPELAVTLAMKLARLGEAVITSVLTGIIVRWIAPASRFAPWIVGGIILALFLPEHVRIWSRLPVWYHAFFLLTLAPLIALGARLRRSTQPGG
ncbi:MAG: hypothetical protein ACXWNN_14180 [Candidatus Binataceae bacterium]